MTETQTNSKRPASLAQFLQARQPTVQTKRIPHLQDAAMRELDLNSGLPKASKPAASDQAYAAKTAVKISNKNFVEPLRSQSVQMDPEKLNPGLGMSPTAITNSGPLVLKKAKSDGVD